MSLIFQMTRLTNKCKIQKHKYIKLKINATAYLNLFHCNVMPKFLTFNYKFEHLQNLWLLVRFNGTSPAEFLCEKRN